jgi:hypothetical protein
MLLTDTSSRPFIVGVGGAASNVGKTTLLCELLQGLAGWEAIKTTRGHYRSCGKDPEACCVSHLLTEEPNVRSGAEETYEKGKDTGRYWDSGASNVHWVIATEAQVESGIREAMNRVRSKGLLVEGNSFSEYIPVDFMIMVMRNGGEAMKKTARRAFPRCAAVYLSDPDAVSVDEKILRLLERETDGRVNGLHVYRKNEVSLLGDEIERRVNAREREKVSFSAGNP